MNDLASIPKQSNGETQSAISNDGLVLLNKYGYKIVVKPLRLRTDDNKANIKAKPVAEQALPYQELPSTDYGGHFEQQLLSPNAPGGTLLAAFMATRAKKAGSKSRGGGTGTFELIDHPNEVDRFGIAKDDDSIGNKYNMVKPATKPEVEPSCPFHPGDVNLRLLMLQEYGGKC